MQIQMNQNSIEEAVKNYIAAMGITLPINDVAFTMTRTNGGGIIAEVDLEDLLSTPKQETQVTPQATYVEQKEVKAAPKKVTKPVEEVKAEPVAEKAPEEPTAPKAVESKPAAKSIFG